MVLSADWLRCWSAGSGSAWPSRLAAPVGPHVFRLAFIFVAVLGACGLIDLVSLPRDAGSRVSGHRKTS